MNLDDYIRRSNLIFQEVPDREASAREQELLARLHELSVDVEDLRKVLRDEGRRKGKTDAQSRRWANEVLLRLRALLEQE
jgi:hypothetical protein